MQVEIKNFSDTHALTVVIDRGRQYSSIWAKEWDELGEMISPTEKEVRKAFKENRKNFDPYNVRRGY